MPQPVVWVLWLVFAVIAFYVVIHLLRMVGVPIG